MLESHKEEPEQNEKKAVNFDDYLIFSYKDAPPGARVFRCMLLGSRHYREYCSRYNELVYAVEESVRKGEMTEKDAVECLQECREW